jgi:transposase
LFELVLQRCIVEGLVGGEEFATDASIVKADASRQRSHIPAFRVAVYLILLR